MPLKLIGPQPGRTPNYTIRGTYLGISVERSAATSDKRTAQRALAKIKADIENRSFAKPNEPGFAAAALNHMQTGGSPRFIEGLLLHFGDAPLSSVTQEAIDAAALELYPNASAATRNRQVYAPASAVLRRAGVSMVLKRPKGSAGTPRTAWLSEDQAFALLDAGNAVSPSFGALLTFLLYTGCRLSEALALTCDDVDLVRGLASIVQRKTDSFRVAPLHPCIIAALANLPRGMERGPDRVFRLTKCGRLYHDIGHALAAAGIVLPARVAFHVLRHTWATWMRRYQGLDTAGLVATGAWKSRTAASIYEHTEASAESDKARFLPARKTHGSG